MCKRANETSKILWIGGTSMLTRTFLNSQLMDPEQLVLMGLESEAPEWIPLECSYISCDLTTVTEAQAKDLFQANSDITHIVIGVRPLLFAPYHDATMDIPQRMLRGIETLLWQACQHANLKLVLHISSVAAMDHLQAQHLVSEQDEYPPISQYKSSYDVFKRHCEESISAVVQKANDANNSLTIPMCHMRLSALFSDDECCLACNSMYMMSFVAFSNLPAIDCNSSVNVSRAIRTLLEHTSFSNNKKIQPVYYYTRPLSLLKPASYSYYLQQFHKAHQVGHSVIWMPFWVYNALATGLNWLAETCRRYGVQIPYLDTLNYLILVATREHSFDCSQFGRDFPSFAKQEETIYDCFVRRRKRLTKEREMDDDSQHSASSIISLSKLLSP